MENEIKINESIKLSKMSKGYNWEIRMLPLDKDESDTNKYAELINRIEKLNNEMKERFGDEDGKII